MNTTVRVSIAAIALAAMWTAPSAATCPGLTVFGLTEDQQLVRFRECEPRSFKTMSRA
jgi:hypothetical protein